MPQITSNFILRSKLPNFERDAFDTLEEMAIVPSPWMDEGHISYCREDGQIYIFNTSGYNKDGELITNGEATGMDRWTKLPISPNFSIDDLRMITLDTINDLISISSKDAGDQTVITIEVEEENSETGETEIKNIPISTGTIVYVIEAHKHYFYAKDMNMGDAEQVVEFINDGSVDKGFGWFYPLISSEVVTESKLNEVLIKYAQLEALSNYVKTEDLSDYATTDDLSGLVTNTTLNDYIKKDELVELDEMKTFVKHTELETILDGNNEDDLGYVKTSNLTDTLSNYVQSSTLSNYVSVDAHNESVEDLQKLIEEAKLEGKKLALRAMFESVGASYNEGDEDKELGETIWPGDDHTMVVHKSNMYNLNGIGDLTESDMMNIYSAGHPDSNNTPFKKFAGRGSESGIRTNLPAWGGLDTDMGPISLNSSFKNCDNINTIYFYNGPLGYESYKVICNDMTEAFSGCSKLIAIPQTINVSNITDPELMKDAFVGCEELVYVNLEGLSVDVDMSDCKNLSTNALSNIILNCSGVEVVDGETEVVPINITISEEVMQVVNGTNSIQEALDEMGGKVVLKLPNE